MKFANLHISLDSRKNFALSDTLIRNTPPELLARKRTVVLPRSIKFFLVPDKISTRLEGKYAITMEMDVKQLNNLERLPFQFECQNNHYKLDLPSKIFLEP